MNFHSEKIENIFRNLDTGSNGLTIEEVIKRQKKNGLNLLPTEKPLGKLKIFLSQLNNVLMYILLLAGFTSIFLGHAIDSIIIFLAVLLNVIIGFIQENKANQALSKLKEMVEHKAQVIRAGKKYQIDSSELVIGDIILLEAGNKIPADGRLFEAANLQINEASLTGESIPSNKNIEPANEGASLADRESMVYSGTITVRGSGRAVVVATGIKTELGKIATLVKGTEEDSTPLQKKLDKFSLKIGEYIGIISLFVMIMGVIQGRSLYDMFFTGVALVVASIPEGLSVILTVILTLGMQRMLKRNALTRKLIAAETLGSTTVICTDKTGTLTEGKMHVAHIVIGEKEFELDDFGSRQDEKEAKLVSLALQISMMCNDAFIENSKDELNSWKIVGESTDAALLSAAIQSGLDKDKLLKSQPKIDELPFDSDLKYMLTLHKDKKGYVLYKKGAPEKILEKASYFYHQGTKKHLTENERKTLNKNYLDLTKRGLRVIAVAERKFYDLDWEKNGKWDHVDDETVFVGFIALKDPLREEAKDTIIACIKAGIRPVIITGDHQLTAQTIAEEVGIYTSKNELITGEELDKIDDEKLNKIIGNLNVYARVSPHHKLRIVKALQNKGEVVAMTGDGINDSPALKAADIGISLGNGTDIAKETSDIVLLDNNFKTIVGAIEQGRIIFGNIRKVVTFLLSDSFSQIILVAGSILINQPLALLPAQILWMNIIQDGLPGFALAAEGGEEGIMHKKPIKKNEEILTKQMKIIIFFVGVVRDLFILGIFVYMLRISLDIALIRTFVFASLATNSLINIFSIRDLSKPIWKINIFSNMYLNLAAFFSFIFLLIGIYVPFMHTLLGTTFLPPYLWVVTICTSLATMVGIEAVKHFIKDAI